MTFDAGTAPRVRNREGAAESVEGQRSSPVAEAA